MKMNTKIQNEYRANILCICFNFIAVLFLFLSSPWGSVYRFCTVYFDIFGLDFASFNLAYVVLST